MNKKDFDFTKYIALSELLLKRGKLSHTEIIFYQRSYRFYMNCRENKIDFFVDQLEAAEALQVSDKTVKKCLDRLQELELMRVVGYTKRGQPIYVVFDFSEQLDNVLWDDEEYAKIQNKYKTHRDKNTSKLIKLTEKRKQEAEEEVSTDFKQKSNSTAHIRALEPVESKAGNPALEQSEAPQETISPPIIQSEPEPQTMPQKTIQSDLEHVSLKYSGYIYSFLRDNGFAELANSSEGKELAQELQDYKKVEFKKWIITIKDAA